MYRLSSEMGGLATELKRGFETIGRFDLAKQVDDLEIVERCRCNAPDCGTFYTKAKFEWLGQTLQQVNPKVEGLLAVDLCNGSIVCVEILDRQDVARKLRSLLP